MIDDLGLILTRLLLALVAGGLVGLERAYHGRAAGFRTHSLVCLASSVLMLLVVFQWRIVPGSFMETVRIDPTRMAQGIMTGIGFLGAGVIVKEGVTVRGLTTAASVWMTATIGIMIGLGFYQAAGIATLLALGILALFPWIERIMPAQNYARLEVRFPADVALSEDALFKILSDHHFSGISMGYKQEEIDGRGRMFVYQATLRTRDRFNLTRLADSLRAISAVYDFSVTPTTD